ncbi:MAG: cation diffusion facilitator family transporter [Chthoniobacterales bacterium]
MAHDHSHAPADYNRAFALGVALNLAYIAVEVGVGFTINSIALLADAGHNTSDVLSLLLAWGASYLSQLPATKRRTYGLRKTSVLASLTNAILLLLAIGAIAWEAIRRFSEPHPVPGGTVMWVAGIGVVINTATALLFMKGRKGDINIRGAYLHMAADAGVSVGVVLAGLAIALTGLLWIDPVVSLLIVLVIAVGTWGLLRDSVNLAVDAVPGDIDPEAVRAHLGRQAGVTEVHDLHIWAMSTTETALTAHVVKPESDDADVFLARMAEELHEEFGIAHTTIQLEGVGGCDCCDQTVLNR